jgi:tRNA G37 N-methylase TrmD
MDSRGLSLWCGAGMVCRRHPFIRDMNQSKLFRQKTRVVYVTLRVKHLIRKWRENGEEVNLVILCGHYEGVVERVLN